MDTLLWADNKYCGLIYILHGMIKTCLLLSVDLWAIIKLNGFVVQSER